MAAFWKRGDTRLLVFILLLIAIAVFFYWRLGLKLPPLTLKTEPGFYTVTKVHDGDTISVDMNGSEEIIRMIGVDTPETQRPNTPVQCYGPEASSFTKSLIGTTSVRLEADPLNTNRDRYDRLLRYVYLRDGTLVENRLISEGYGFAYTSFPMVKALEFVALESKAKATGKGLWSACEVSEQPNGVRQTNSAT